MMERKIIKRISTLLLAGALMATTVVSAFAANVRDEDYTRYNVSANTWVNSPARYKENDSKVYVAPAESLSLRTKVKTMCDVGGIITNKTKNSRGYVVLADNVKYAITNFVYEDGDYTTGYGVFMWLGMTPHLWQRHTGRSVESGLDRQRHGYHCITNRNCCCTAATAAAYIAPVQNSSNESCRDCQTDRNRQLSLLY